MKLKVFLEEYIIKSVFSLKKTSQKFSPTSWREICGLLNGVDGVQSSAQHKMASGGGNNGKAGVSTSVVVQDHHLHHSVIDLCEGLLFSLTKNVCNHDIIHQ